MILTVSIVDYNKITERILVEIDDINDTTRFTNTHNNS